MPTPIKDAGKKALHQALASMLKLTRNNRYTIHYVDFLLLYWDKDTIDMVNTVKSIVDSVQLDAHSPKATHVMVYTHPVFPDPLELTFQLDIDEPSNVRVLWPRGFALRHDCDMAVRDKMESMFERIGAEAVDRGLFKEVSEFLIDESKSYEASAYLCPAFVSLMRRAGMRELANHCDGDVQRVPNLPALPFLMRQKIRHVNEWFAIQELLGTWEGDRGPKPADHIEITLSGNYTFLRKYDGQSFYVNMTC